MRLLYLHYSSQSGVGEVVRRVAAKLQQRGIEVILFNPVDELFVKWNLTRKRVPKVKLEVLRCALAAAQGHGKGWKAHFFLSSYAFDLLTSICDGACWRYKPDGVLQGGVLFAPLKTYKCPYALYLDNTAAITERDPSIPHLPPVLHSDPAWRARERLVYQRAERILAMSEFVKASLIGDYGIDSKRIEVVGAGPSIAPVQNGTLTRRRESAFLFVGTDFTRKGGLQLLTAFQEVRRLNPSAELWLVGGYKLRSAPPGVRCFGWLDRAELEQLYSRACCFVMPTLRERFGLAFLEAMSFGLPCIGTNTQAIPEIIVEGVTGFLVPSGDTSALAEKMTRILEDPDAAEAMGKAGLRRVSTEFGWSRVADAIIRGLSLKPASVGGLAH